MADTMQVPLATKYRVINDQRMVVLTGRDQFALNDTNIAVPFALLKFLAGSLMTVEGQAELARSGGALLDTSGGKNPT